MDDEKQCREETAGQFLQRVGMDGKLWAAEMHKRFPQVPEDDLLGWCCNMIMAGYDEAKRQSSPLPVASGDALAIAEKGLLLAARWFGLNFADDTLSEHPPSKTDLAGMFDAMQQARGDIRPHLSRTLSPAPKSVSVSLEDIFNKVILTGLYHNELFDEAEEYYKKVVSTALDAARVPYVD